MGHYDLFSSIYDLSIEPHYRPQREAAAAALDLQPGLRVLDVPCGTGLSFPHLMAGIGAAGTLLGADLSSGMLGKAKKRVAQAGWDNVVVLGCGVDDLDLDMLSGGPVDRLHMFLGLSAFPDADAGFAAAWALLRPGGRCVVVDVWAQTLSFQGRLVNWTAKADIERRSWEPLEQRATDFQKRDLPSTATHGGQIFLATGIKP